ANVGPRRRQRAKRGLSHPDLRQYEPPLPSIPSARPSCGTSPRDLLLFNASHLQQVRMCASLLFLSVVSSLLTSLGGSRQPPSPEPPARLGERGSRRGREELCRRVSPSSVLAARRSSRASR